VRAHTERRDAGRAQSERPRVDQKRAAGTHRRHHEAAQRRAEQARAGLAHELVERIGLDELVRGHDVGHERAESGPEEGLAGAEQHDEADEVPDLEHPGQREHADGDEHRGPDQVGTDQHAATLHPVADDPAGE